MVYRKSEERLKHTNAVREALLAAARKLLEDEGIAAVTVRRVISQANSSIGNYYFYFRDKHSLLTTLITDELKKVGQKIDQYAEKARSASLGKAGILATMVYAGIRIGLEGPPLYSRIFSGALRNITRPLMEKFYIERTERIFRQMPELTQKIDEPLISTFWQATILLLLEKVLSGEIDVNTEQAAQSCVRWNLLAMGISETEMEKALKDAVQVWNTFSS